MEKRAISNTEEYTKKIEKTIYNNIKNNMAKDFNKDEKQNKKEQNIITISSLKDTCKHYKTRVK